TESEDADRSYARHDCRGSRGGDASGIGTRSKPDRADVSRETLDIGESIVPAIGRSDRGAKGASVVQGGNRTAAKIEPVAPPKASGHRKRELPPHGQRSSNALLTICRRR